MKSFAQKLFGKDARYKFRHFFSIMIPILVTQSAIMGMNFFDTVMSGRAGAEQLAGTSIGTNLWMPVFTTINGILIAATPLTAHLLGAGKKAETGRIVRHGLLLALLFSFLCFAAGFCFLEPFIRRLGLEPQVAYIARFYLAGIGIGIIPFFMGTVLRSFIDTMGGTRLTMQVYLATLPLNIILNYILIFGKLGIPPLGGIGAGIGTGITCWFLFGMFALIIRWHPLYRDIPIFTERSREPEAKGKGGDRAESANSPVHNPATRTDGSACCNQSSRFSSRHTHRAVHLYGDQHLRRSCIYGGAFRYRCHCGQSGFYELCRLCLYAPAECFHEHDNPDRHRGRRQALDQC